MRILVVLPSALTLSHREALTASRTLGEVDVVSLGTPDLETMARFGVSRVLVPSGPSLDTPAQIADAVAQIASRDIPDAIVGVSSFVGKEVAARLAVRLGGGAIVDVSSLRTDGDRIVAGKTVFASTWDTECTVTEGVPILAIKPTSFDVVETPGAQPSVEQVEVQLSEAARGVELVDRTVPPSSTRPALEEARIAVVGGRGVDGDFSLVEQLADALGAAVGATRVATDESWIDHSAQIGQTGVTIAPKLYIGLGVSGAVHHTAGMTGAEVVVAVNTDSDAPIFEIADFGIVGDLNSVVPDLLAALGR